MTFLRLAIEARRLDLAAYALVHSAAWVLAQQTTGNPTPDAPDPRKEEDRLARRTTRKGQ